MNVSKKLKPVCLNILCIIQVVTMQKKRVVINHGLQDHNQFTDSITPRGLFANMIEKSNRFTNNAGKQKANKILPHKFWNM